MALLPEMDVETEIMRLETIIKLPEMDYSIWIIQNG